MNPLPQQPLVSVITTVRNGASTLESTLASVANQKMTHWEHLIVDAESTDGSLAIIQRYASPRLRWISEADDGVYAGLNKGISMARGEWFIFLGADDVFSDEWVLHDVFTQEEYDLHDCILGCSSYSDGRQCLPRLNWRTLIFNTVHHQAAFYHRRLFQDFFYRTDIPVVADYEINLRLYLGRNPVLALPRQIAASRVGGLSQRIRRLDSLRDLYRIRKKYLGRTANAILLLLGLLDLLIARSRARLT